MSHAYWYATRGSGVVALVLLTLVVALGVAGSLRLGSPRWPRFLVAGLHRSLTLLTLVFLAVHVVTTVLDSYTPISLRDAFVPFLASYRPLWLGLGAISFDLLLALTVTSLLRARIGYRSWRVLHWLAYAAWPVALLHGLGTGSDARFGWLQALTAACVLLVLASVGARLRTAPAGPRLLAGSAALLGVVLGVVWYGAGPDSRGWAARAGTPQRLLPSRVASPPASVSRQTTPSIPAPPFHARLSGRLTTHVDHTQGLVVVDIRGRTTGGVKGLLWIRLQGVPADGGGVSLTASGAGFGTPGAPNAYTGSVEELQGTDVAVGLKNASGSHLTLSVQLQVDQARGTFTGRVEGTA